MGTRKPARAPRVISVALMGLTATFTLLGGAGTSCVALAADRWANMSALAPYMWLYRILVILTVADAIAGIWATVGLARGRRNAYGVALVALLAGLLLAGIQMFASLQLRGGAAPTNMRLYLTAFTLVIFLLLRLQPVWRRSFLDPSGGQNSRDTTAGLSAFLSGAIVLTTSLWAGPSHTFEGHNWVLVWQAPLILCGFCLMAAGIILLARGMGAQGVECTERMQTDASQAA